MTTEAKLFLDQLHAAVMSNVPREDCPPEGILKLELTPTMEALAKKYDLSYLEVADSDFEKQHDVPKMQMMLRVGKCFQVPKDFEAYYIAPYGVKTWVVNRKGNISENSSIDRAVSAGTYFYDGNRIIELPNPIMSREYFECGKRFLSKQDFEHTRDACDIALVLDETNQEAKELLKRL